MKKNQLKKNKKSARPSPALKSISEISTKLNPDGFQLNIFNQSYQVKYQLKIWRNLAQKSQKVLAENFAYGRTAPLNIVNHSNLWYETSRPVLKNFVDYGIIGDLPRISERFNLNSKKLLASFKNSRRSGRIIFAQRDKFIKLLPKAKTKKDKAIISLSFGKDSLLSYGLAKEIGLDYRIFFVEESEREKTAEWFWKKKIIKQFCQKERQKVYLVKDNIEKLFFHPKLSGKFKELENINGMLAFALELIPAAYYHRAKYLIFGNEATFNNFFINHDGFKAYPSFDQTSVYTRKENNDLDVLTDGNIQVVSLVEPLYDLAEMKILHQRYPHLLKYLMSCSPTAEKSERWCYQCATCANAFLAILAVGGNPKEISFFSPNFFIQEIII